METEDQNSKLRRERDAPRRAGERSRRVAEPFFSEPGLSRAPASHAVAGREVTPLQGWRQELGLVAAGSPSCCTNCSLPVPNPTGSQSPASPHGHARQQNPSFLRRYEVYEARGLRGFPQASGHRSALSPASPLASTRPNRTAVLQPREGRQLVPGGDRSPEIRAKAELWAL